MKEGITGFLYETPTKKSSKRLIALLFAIYSMIMSAVVYWISGEYVAFIAVWGATTATVLILIGVGKAQENERKQIENGNKE
ncbi:MAG: hypothetical protein ACTSQF_00180 [Candidatus Heimdallarchaeaceae archaeon]